MTFPLLIYASIFLDDYDIWLPSFWPIFVKRIIESIGYCEFIINIHFVGCKFMLKISWF